MVIALELAMFITRLAVLLVLGSAACASQKVTPALHDAPEQAAVRGQRFATQACAGCHAIGPAGASPMAGTPPFREIVHRYSLDQLEQAFATGLVTGHPAMPAFVFRASEIDDLIAYLETVKSER